MKTYVITALSLVLIFCSCHKEDDLQTDHDFRKSFDRGLLDRHNWFPEGRNAAEAAANRKTIALAGKFDVILFFTAGNYYLRYDSLVAGGTDTLYVQETGVYLVNPDQRTIFFHPTDVYWDTFHTIRKDYTCTVPVLDRKHLHLVHTYPCVQTVINNEGNPVQQNGTQTETIYFTSIGSDKMGC